MIETKLFPCVLVMTARAIGVAVLPGELPGMPVLVARRTTDILHPENSRFLSLNRADGMTAITE
jgi:hypothetical protein